MKTKTETCPPFFHIHIFFRSNDSCAVVMIWYYISMTSGKKSPFRNRLETIFLLSRQNKIVEFWSVFGKLKVKDSTVTANSRVR